MEKCKYCNNGKFILEIKGNNTGKYCNKCGKWQKWLSKDELRLVNQESLPKQIVENTNYDEAIKIGSVSTIKLTKTELIEILENNYNDKDYVCVLTEISSRDIDDQVVKTQSLVLSKVVKW